MNIRDHPELMWHLHTIYGMLSDGPSPRNKSRLTTSAFAPWFQKHRQTPWNGNHPCCSLLQTNRQTGESVDATKLVHYLPASRCYAVDLSFFSQRACPFFFLCFFFFEFLQYFFFSCATKDRQTTSLNHNVSPTIRIWQTSSWEKCHRVLRKLKVITKPLWKIICFVILSWSSIAPLKGSAYKNDILMTDLSKKIILFCVVADTEPV